MKWIAASAISVALLTPGRPANVADTVAAAPRPVEQVRDPAAAAEWRARGLAFGYNLDRPEAFAALQHAIDADPQSPAAYRLLAASAWTALVFEQGAITVDDFLGEARAHYKRSTPNAELAKVFHDALGRAVSLSEEQLRARPNDPMAHFQVGAA